MHSRLSRSPACQMAAPLAMTALLLLAGCGDQRLPLAPRGQFDPLEYADPDRGRQLVRRYGCAACHTVPGVRAPLSNVGPPLEKMGSRAYVGGVLPNTPANLVRWLLDPPAVDPRTAMPNVGMNEADARHIAAYLLTLD